MRTQITRWLVMAADVEMRRAGSEDVPAILELARRSLGWDASDDDARFFHWKHFENPFGVSPMWVAVDGGRVVGFRTFLHWEFRTVEGELLTAVRAVDTATDPEYQGHGIFTRLTMQAVDELRGEGVDLIFNTPNPRSRPGYVKMGWSIVGRLPVAIKPTKISSVLALAKARMPAHRWSIEVAAGNSASDVLADQSAISRLLSAMERPGVVETERTPGFLAWRYGFKPLHYRAVLAGPSPADGLVVFRLRIRGDAVEAVVCDVLLPFGDVRGERELLARVARSTGADYLIRLQSVPIGRGRFIRLPFTGPVLACRRLDEGPVPRMRDWGLTLGDIELF